MNYYLDLAILVISLIPCDIRNDFLLEWLYCLISPLKVTNSKLVAFSEDTNYKTAFSAQIIYLEHTLNDIFDPIDRTIIIEDGVKLPVFYTFNENEVGIPSYIWDESETSVLPIYSFGENETYNEYDFAVKVPLNISLTDISLISTINYYNLAGKKFIIKY